MLVQVSSVNSSINLELAACVREDEMKIRQPPAVTTCIPEQSALLAALAQAGVLNRQPRALVVLQKTFYFDDDNNSLAKAGYKLRRRNHAQEITSIEGFKSLCKTAEVQSRLEVEFDIGLWTQTNLRQHDRFYEIVSRRLMPSKSAYETLKLQQKKIRKGIIDALYQRLRNNRVLFLENPGSRKLTSLQDFLNNNRITANIENVYDIFNIAFVQTTPFNAAKYLTGQHATHYPADFVATLQAIDPVAVVWQSYDIVKRCFIDAHYGGTSCELAIDYGYSFDKYGTPRFEISEIELEVKHSCGDVTRDAENFVILKEIVKTAIRRQGELSDNDLLAASPSKGMLAYYACRYGEKMHKYEALLQLPIVKSQQPSPTLDFDAMPPARSPHLNFNP